MVTNLSPLNRSQVMHTDQTNEAEAITRWSKKFYTMEKSQYQEITTAGFKIVENAGMGTFIKIILTYQIVTVNYQYKKYGRKYTGYIGYNPTEEKF